MEQNKIYNRASGVQLDGNAVNEDRVCCHQFKSFDGYFVAVYDGHGGWQVADMCARKMQTYLEENLAGKKREKDVIKGIKKAFDQVESDALNVAKGCFNAGFAQTAYVGSCALVAIVHENKLYVANAGDCKGVLLSQQEDGSHQSINVSKTFSANKKYEQERLQKQFPKEKDIFVC